MKRTLRLVGMAAMVLLLAVSCRKEEESNGETQRMTFTAGIEQGGSKTGLIPNGPHAFNQVWSENDAINVNGKEFSLIDGVDKQLGTFDGEVVPADRYYAVYPSTASLNGSNATFNLPATQSYVENSYASNLAPMAAMSQTSQLKFKNLCGLMELWLMGDGITVTSLVLSCNEPICGQTKPYDMNALATDEPATLEMAGTGNKITMSIDSGIELGETSTPFIFVLPPLEDGNFSLKISYQKVGSRYTYVETINLPEGISIEASKVVYNSVAFSIGMVRTEDVSGVEVDPTTNMKVTYSVDEISGYRIIEHGVCYGTSENPDLTGSPAKYQGEGSSPYTITISNLTPGKKYYVRAYAIYESETKSGSGSTIVIYGNELEYTTVLVIPEGALSGKFSVAQGKQVYFSKGNLWCNNANPLSPVWSFEDNQYDYHTFETTADGMVQNGSVSNNTANTWGLFAWSCQTYPYGMATQSASTNFDAVFVDWGTNPISNGGNDASKYHWRTLTAPQTNGGEWEYLLNTRPGNRFAYAQVGGINGLVVFPDGWISSTSFSFTNINVDKKNYSVNVITTAQWGSLQEEGCLFLPAVGDKNGSGSWLNKNYGYYWANGVANSGNNSKCLTFGNSMWKPGDNSSGRNFGMSVRLVIDVPDK